MLCVTLPGYQRACGPVTGGISEIGVFDPFDLNFTQGAAVNGVYPAYTAVAERAGASTPSIHMVTFQVDEAEWTWKQTVKGCSVKYEHEFIFQLTENAQLLTNFLEGIDAAGCCCGLGIIVRLNSGKIFVAGERYVNDVAITRFIMKNDGSEGSSGKLFDDYNGGTIHFKGSYNRNLYEYTGTWDSLENLSDIAGS